MQQSIKLLPEPTLHTCTNCAHIGIPELYTASDFIGDNKPKIGTAYYRCFLCKSSDIESIPHNTRKICRDCNFFEPLGSNIDSDGLCVLFSRDGNKVRHLETCEYWVLVK